MANLPEQPVWMEGIYQIDENDDVVGGPLPEGISNLQGKQLADRTRYLKDTLEAEIETREELSETVTAQGDEIGENTENIGSIAQRVQILEGRGGPVDAHDFGSASPGMEDLTLYACESIWGAGGIWAWDSAEPWNSTYAPSDVTHTAGEIFSSTWVRNTYNILYHDEAEAQAKMEARFGSGGAFTWNADDPPQSTYVIGDETHYLIEIAEPFTLNHKWVLTNTPDTDPRVFSWQNVGQDIVAIANESLPGVVRSGGDVVVDPVNGKMYVPAAALPGRFLISSDKRKIKIKAGTSLVLKFNGKRRGFYTDVDMELNIEALLDTGALQNGKDYYIFLCAEQEGDGVVIAVSLSKTNPQGYTADQVMLIGGFHTLCVNAGTGMTYTFGGGTLDHPLNGYVAGDILPQSVWCLNHRSFSEPEGMVYIPTLDFWCDIYLQSGSGMNTKSAYQGNITRLRQYVDFVEDQFCVRKELLDDGEFAAAMLGSNEQTAVSGASEAGAATGGAGGRKDTANRRMISIIRSGRRVREPVAVA
jgi:hypothetical protein